MAGSGVPAEQQRILVTGGSGLLGTALRRLLPGANYPTSAEFDVINYEQMDRFVARLPLALVIHAAAFTSPPRIEEDPVRAIQTNILGTANVTRLCMAVGVRLVYVSTDYVFRGDRGGYSEEDAVYPVNKYAWSKLGGECAVRLYDRSLIIRTSFGPDVFPYPAAFSDQWTSRIPVSEAARQIVDVASRETTGLIHLGGPRRTVLEYARSLDPERAVDAISREDVTFAVPRDTSLDLSRLRALVGAE